MMKHIPWISLWTQVPLCSSILNSHVGKFHLWGANEPKLLSWPSFLHYLNNALHPSGAKRIPQGINIIPIYHHHLSLKHTVLGLLHLAWTEAKSGSKLNRSPMNFQNTSVKYGWCWLWKLKKGTRTDLTRTIKSSIFYRLETENSAFLWPSSSKKSMLNHFQIDTLKI